MHDGFLIVAPLDRLHGEIERMKAIMVRASEIVTGGLPINVEVEAVSFPDRYMDERGRSDVGSRHRAFGAKKQGNRKERKSRRLENVHRPPTSRQNA